MLVFISIQFSDPTGNGVPSYGQRMPVPGQPNQYQQGNMPYPQSAGSAPQYPPNHNQMGYGGGGGAPSQSTWPHNQQMSSDMPRMPSQGTWCYVAFVALMFSFLALLVLCLSSK